MLDAARAVFSDRGYAQASVEEIADRAEFGKGTLYNYFPGGKDEVLRAVLDELFDEVDGLLAPLLDGPADGPADGPSFRLALRDYFRRSALFFYRDPSVYHLAVRETWRLWLSAESEGRDHLVERVERSAGALAGDAERAVAAGALRPLPTRPFAYAVLSGVANQVAAREVAGWPDDPEAAADETAAFLTALVLDGAAP